MNLTEQDILQTLMKWRTRMSAAAWVVVRDAHAAEDIFQNVALKAMTREVSFETASALLSWAFITARREGIDWLRRHRRVSTCLDAEVLELLELEWQARPAHASGERIEALRDCLESVPEVSRRLLKLRYFDGYSCEEVADQMGLGLNAIYKRVSRLHESLKDCIEGSTITIAGHSTSRLLEAETGKKRFELLQGSLWGTPARGPAPEAVLIQTPTVAAEMRGAQFDIQTSPTETMVRVNDGSARVRQNLNGRAVEVPKGQQVAASLSRKESLSVTPQPGPVSSWACDLSQVPEVILGKWLHLSGNERARLGAEPLLWPISRQDSVMLYAVALAAWKTSERPVLLQSDSRFRFRGRTERAHTIRFGFSAQKMRGVFAGKFELDVPPALLRPAGETWEVELPLANFRPLQPQLYSSPDGLELTDVYALTIQEDAGLEINAIELVPRK